MINREDMLELTRRMTVSRTSMTRIAGAYLDKEGFIDGTFNTNFLKLSPAEKEKNLEREQAAVERIHQMEVNSGVDVHVPVDVDYEDGFENREASNGEGQK